MAFTLNSFVFSGPETLLLGEEAEHPSTPLLRVGLWVLPPLFHAFPDLASTEIAPANAWRSPLRLSLPICAVYCRSFCFLTTLAFPHSAFFYLSGQSLLDAARASAALPPPSPDTGVLSLPLFLSTCSFQVIASISAP